MYTNNTIEQLSLSIDIEETSVPSCKKTHFSTLFKPTNHDVPDLESVIPEHHIARIVDEFVESIPYEILIAHYDSGGRAPYHPKLMLKIILYGYTQKVYSSRRKDKDGFKRDFKIYECEDCSNYCPLKELCTKAKGNRQVHYNPVYEEMKGKAKQLLRTKR